jgi:hypothetical protein
MKKCSPIAAVLLLIAQLFPTVSSAGPAEEFDLTKLGEGKLRWFGLSIYTASLWSESDASLAGFYDSQIMLSLNYARNIKKERILDTTRDEWKKLDGKFDEREAAWLIQLAEIFPDISAGDRLSSLVIPGKETRFFLDDKEIGRITDADFGPAFLAIWLDPNTSSKPIRAKLLDKLLQANAAKIIAPADTAKL